MAAQRVAQTWSTPMMRHDLNQNKKADLEDCQTAGPQNHVSVDTLGATPHDSCCSEVTAGNSCCETEAASDHKTVGIASNHICEMAKTADDSCPVNELLKKNDSSFISLMGGEKCHLELTATDSLLVGSEAAMNTSYLGSKGGSSLPVNSLLIENSESDSNLVFCCCCCNSDASCSGRQSSEVAALEAKKRKEDNLLVKERTEDPNNRRPSKGQQWKKLSRYMKITPFLQTFRKKKYPWKQLAGHSGSFLKGPTQGTILKKMGNQEEICYRLLMEDDLSPVVPKFYRVVEKDGKKYLELKCCQSEFDSPNIMDAKMGVRTFLTSETKNTSLREDLYQKMIAEDPQAPTEAENLSKSISKYRYLNWRDCVSTSRSMGFRIEGTVIESKESKKYKFLNANSDVLDVISAFCTDEKLIKSYIEELKRIRSLCLQSQFFADHELVGSSLLFIHDKHKVGVWMIDFEKTTPTSPNPISHDKPWVEGSREDGYLIGLNSLISLFEQSLDSHKQ